MKICIFVSDTFNPWFNLATENWIFNDMPSDTQVLFLWRNQETVVIGRYQNPWIECNTKKMDEDNVILTRRQSGGGAVFHDLGNTNFTFLSPREHYKKEVNNEIIIKALKRFNINAFASGRNDIMAIDHEGEKKISGSAFKEKKDRCFHHGTLLINANLSKLANYLNPDPKKLESKGIASVRARVTNLSLINPEINHENLCQAIIEEFQYFYGVSCEIQKLDHSELSKIKELNDYYQFLKSDEWRFGETPRFTHHLEERFSWGGMDIHLNVEKNKIKQVKIFSDSLHPEMIEEVERALTGQEYRKSAIIDACENVKRELAMIADDIEEFKVWLADKIS